MHVNSSLTPASDASTLQNKYLGAKRLLNLCSCVQSLPLVPCSGDDGDAGSRLVPCTFGTYRSPQDQGWLSKGREGRKTSADVLQHQTPLHNDIPTLIYLSSTTNCRNLQGIYSLLFARMPLSTMLHTEASAWSQRAYYSLSSHLSNILEPWDPPSREREKRCCVPGFPLISW